MLEAGGSMPYQFFHIDAVSKQGRKIYSNKNGKKTETGYISVESVLDEAGRLNCYFSHVEKPQPPVILYGDKDKGIEDVRQKNNEWTENTKDARGHKIRKDAMSLLSGVASWPPIEDDEDIKEYNTKKNAFETALIEWLKNVYGEDLALVLRHDDEPFKGINKGKVHYHWHFFCVKKKGQKFDLHKGFKARSEYNISRKDRLTMTPEQIKAFNDEGKLAYKKAMSDFQEKFYQELSKFHGFERYGPLRLRRTREEQKEFEEIREQVIEAAKKEAKEEAQKIKDQANTDADEIKNEAINEAQNTIQTAEKQAIEIKKSADDEAEKTKQDARNAAQIMENTAKSQAAETRKEADEEAKKIKQDARNAAQIMENTAKSQAAETRKKADEEAKDIHTKAENQAAEIKKKADEEAKETKDKAWEKAKNITEIAEKRAETIFTNAKGFINLLLENAAKLPGGETLVNWAKTFIKNVTGKNQTIIQDTNDIKPTRKR